MAARETGKRTESLPRAPAGDRVRMRVLLDAVEPIQSGTALSLTLTVEHVYE